MNSYHDDYHAHSTLFSTLTGVLLGIALMTLLDRDKRRSVLNTARDLKDRAVNTTDEIARDLTQIKDSAVENAQNFKDDVKRQTNR